MLYLSNDCGSRKSLKLVATTLTTTVCLGHVPYCTVTTGSHLLGIGAIHGMPCILHNKCKCSLIEKDGALDITTPVLHLSALHSLKRMQGTLNGTHAQVTPQFLLCSRAVNGIGPGLLQ